MLRWPGLAALLLVFLASGTARAQAPAAGELVVNEVMYDPPQTPEGTYEWVEILNTSDRTLDLNDVQFGDSGTLVEITGTAAPLAPGAFAVLVKDAATFNATFPGTPGLVLQVAGFPALNNTGDTVRLVASAGGTAIDAVPYLPSWGGTAASLERRDPAGPSTSAANFGTTTDPAGGTPGRQNAIFETDTVGPTLVSATASADGRTVTVTVSEPLDPASVAPGAFAVAGRTVTAAAYTAGETTVALTLNAPLPAGTTTITASNLRDLRGNVTPTSQTTVDYAPDVTPPALTSGAAPDATTVVATFSEPLDAATVAPGDFQIDGGIGAPASVVVSGATVTLTLAAPLQNATAYTLTVTNVADGAGNVLASASLPFFFGSADPPAARDVVVNEIMYDPPAPQPATNEWIEVVNRSGRAVDVGGLVVTDGGTPSAALPSPFVLAPGAFAVFVANGPAFAAAFPSVPFTALSGFPTLNNTGDRVAILVGGTEIDAVPYQASWGGMDASLERRDPNGPSTSSRNFATTTAPLRGTPGAQNSQFAPDVTGPLLLSATASPDGRTVVVTLDEPADPASVTLGAFAVAGRTVTAAAYNDAEATVTLTLDAPLAAGGATVTATNLVDLLGNVTPTSQTTVAFTPDTTAPTLTRAFAPTPTTVRVVFSEPLTASSASDPAAYAIDGGIGTPTDVVTESDDAGVVAVTLTLPAPLTERQIYTLTVTGLTDLAGNAAGALTAPLFFGTADTPAPGEMVVNEILYDPAGGSDGEFVELLNTTADRVFDLRALTLDGDAVSSDPAPVLPGQFVVVARNAEAFASAFPGVPFVELTGLSLSNSGDTVTLQAGDAVIDSVAYDPDWHREELDDATGLSLERRDAAGPSSAASNWSSSLDPSGATPGRANTATVATNPQPRDGGITVTSPFAPDDGEAGRIAYTLEAPAALVRVRIYDGGGRLVREVEDDRLSGSAGEVLWDGRGMGGERLRAGIYVVLLEAVDVEGGTSEAHRAVIVLARR